MPNHRFNWHEHIKEIEGEYQAARAAVDRFMANVDKSPDIATEDERAHVRNAQRNLEGTYLVRLFAAFQGALRSYDRARHNDPTREEHASVLIDSIGVGRGMGISEAVRRGAHKVRMVRNYWAHENETEPDPMTLAKARARLQTFLSWLPAEWA